MEAPKGVKAQLQSFLTSTVSGSGHFQAPEKQPPYPPNRRLYGSHNSSGRFEESSGVAAEN